MKLIVIIQHQWKRRKCSLRGDNNLYTYCLILHNENNKDRLINNKPS